MLNVTGLAFKPYQTADKKRWGERDRTQKNCSFEITVHTHPQFVGKMGTSLLVHHKFPNCMIVNFCCFFLLLL
jgi:hypothetical protein